MHLRFQKAQVSMFTPEEVCSVGDVPWGPNLNFAAAVDLGRSAWLQSFAQQHLDQCRHFRVMFYDYRLDIICEGITAHRGAFNGDRNN